MPYIATEKIFHQNIIRYNLDTLLRSAMERVALFLSLQFQTKVHHTQE